jgi:hypothetical protein
MGGVGLCVQLLGSMHDWTMAELEVGAATVLLDIITFHFFRNANFP